MEKECWERKLGMCGKELTLKLLIKQVELLQVGKAAQTSLFQGCFDHNL